MGIFSKRPLALFSFIFLISSLAAFYLSTSEKLILSIAVISIIASLFLLSLLLKKAKIKLITSCVCLFALILAMLHSFIFIGLPTQRSKEYIGQGKVLCYVISEEHSSDNIEEYNVKIKNVNGEAVNIRASLICDFDANLSSGDEIYGIGEITDEHSGGSRASNRLLTVYMDGPENCYVRQIPRGIFETLFSECGVEILSHKLTSFIKNELFGTLGVKNGALAMGFLTSERSDMPVEITRDFRRAGVSHLMAVSGTHIAILLGGIELVLRKLSVHKKIRCITVSLLSVLFLFVTGFSLSACRSVFMLYAVYLSYFLYEDSDPLTSLFASVALIVMLFPYSVIDLSLIMSFLATLGLLTVYPILEQRIPYPRKKKKLLKKLLLICREAALIAIMTVIANMFLLPIIWYFFGEFSLISIVSNILLSFISSAFLLIVPVFLIFSKIPLIGLLLRYTVSLLADLILFTVGLCSKAPFATVSLRYGFCNIIVALFTVSICVLMIVKLKHRLFVLIPYGAAVISFIICFCVYNAVNSAPKVTYLNYGENEYFIIQDNTSFSVCDNTGGGLGAYYKIADILDTSTATEIDKYILTHYHCGHITGLDLITEREIVRHIYLPIPKTNDEIICSEELWKIANEKGIDVLFYSGGEQIKLTEEINMQAVSSDNGRYIAFSGFSDSLVYMSPAYYDSSVDFDLLILGEHDVDTDRIYFIENTNADKIYISSEKIKNIIKLSSVENVFIPQSSYENYKATFTLE